MRHLQLKRIKSLTSYQKLAIGSWRSAKDPSIYGWHDIDCAKALKLKKKILREKGINLTPTYTAAQAFSLIFASRPQMNTLLRGGQLYQRKQVSFSFLTAIDLKGRGGGPDRLDLSACAVHDITKLGLLELYEVLSEKIRRAKHGADEIAAAQSRLLKKIPSPLMGLFLDISSFFLYTLNLSFKGLPRDPFGSLMISNLGQIGIDSALIPLVPYSRAPVNAAIGLVKPRPAVTESRELAVRDMLRISYTIDHRHIDGKSLSLMQKMLFFIFQDPERWMLPPPEAIKEEFLREFNASQAQSSR